MSKITIRKLVTLLFIFFLISILSIYSASKYLTINNLVIKQVMFYFIGIIIILVMLKIKNNIFIKYAWLIYIINILLLILVLFFGKDINGSRAWFVIPNFGNIQPSEFMKISLILVLAKIIAKDCNKKSLTITEEFKLIMKVLIVTIIPSILTFLEPDTGAIFMYLIIALIMLFSSKIRYRWFIVLFILVGLALGFILITYFYTPELFIKIFKDDLFYRLDRILDWSKGQGMQLTNSLIGIGSSGILGSGIKGNNIYFPEPHTDFIFATFTSCFGLFGAFLLLCVIIIFDFNIIKIATKCKIDVNKYIIIGILAILIYQQLQNIAMTIGLLPITGITLPFISYGGSSLMSYMIAMGLIFNIVKERESFF